MKKNFLFVVLVMLLLCGAACNRAIVPDDILEGLHKPVLKSLSPAAVQFNGAGFFLNVATEYLEDDQYVLYINDRKIGQDVPGYWRTSLGWMLSKELIAELLASSPNGVTCSVRISSINEDYDISGFFDKYRDYVSEPLALEMKKGETRFSEARQLFPEWTHSSEPVIRCDANGNLYLAWVEKLNGTYQAFFSFSRDAGAGWSQVLNISRSAENVGEIDLGADGAGHFYLVWREGVDEASSIFFSRSLDWGATWQFPVKMNAAGAESTWPVIAVNDRADVSLAWMESDSVIRLSVSSDFGKSWNVTNFNVPKSYQGNEQPVLASGPGGDVCLLNGGLMTELQGFYHFFSRDYGASWQEQEVSTANIYPFHGYARARAILSETGNGYFVWGDSSSAGHTSWNGNFFLRREGSRHEWSEVESLHELCRTVNEKTALSVRPDGIDVVLTENGGLFLLRSAEEGRTWSIPEFIPGADGLLATTSPDTVRHPSGKTFLVYIRKNTPMDGGLYLTTFE
ncbi:MAG TPA: sialidase family protein [Patescibacteria group bacterium]|nr:sialidase family protein [Patescibacteria group bacterium]